MKPRPVVALLGAGLLGRAVLGLMLASGTPVRVWVRRPTARRALARRFDRAVVCDSVAEAAEPADVVAIAVPAGGFREVSAAYGAVARGDQVVVHATHGVAEGFVLPHQILRQETCVRMIGALGGPMQARDFTGTGPFVAVLASRFDETLRTLRAAVPDHRVRLHPSRDVVGVEVAGAVSNATGIAVGMADTLDLGDTARGVLLTRGLLEAASLGRVLGADPTTFAGLAGVGDLIPRRVTAADRSHAAGQALASGHPLEHLGEFVRGELEGIATAREAVRLAAQHDLELPLLTLVDAVASGRRAAAEALTELLRLELDLSRGLVPVVG